MPPLLPLLLLVVGWTLVGPAGCDPTSTPNPLSDAVPADTHRPEPGPAAAQLVPAAAETRPTAGETSTAATETSTAATETSTAATETSPTAAEHDPAETEPSNVETEPSGAVTEPSGAVTEPSDAVTEPNDAVTEPSGAVTEPSDAVTEPRNAETKPSSAVTEPGSSVAEPGPAAADKSRAAAGSQASVTLDQIVEEVARLCQATASAATAGPLSELTRVLASLQARVEAVAGRVDLVYASQLQQQDRLDAMELSQTEAASQLARSLSDTATRNEIRVRSQAQASSRIDAIARSQTETASLLSVTLDGLEKRQNETARRLESRLQELQESQSGVSARLDAVETSQQSLSSRMDGQLQQQRAAAAAAEGSVQEQLDAIRADIQAHEDSIEQQLNVIQADIRHIPILGRLCSNDLDCSKNTSEATCGGDGMCSCRDGYRRVSGFECRRNSRLSESCEQDDHCNFITPNSRCTNDTCSCGDRFWNNNNAECRRVGVVSMYGTCVGDKDCDASLGQGCVSGVCECFVKKVGIHEYRLTGGSSCKEGNVQLRWNGGSWGLVCDEYWDNTAAGVVCRSLGFNSGRATRESRYGSGSNFYVYHVRCRGSESHLRECEPNPWFDRDCGAGEVAGVICQN